MAPCRRNVPRALRPCRGEQRGVVQDPPGSVTKRGYAGPIDALLLETKSGRVAVRARTFIDCSCDGDLAHFAGVAMARAARLAPRTALSLLVAGRCASMTHEGHSAARVSGACFVMGQAAGTAAALALLDHVMPHALAPAHLQQALEADGAFLDREPRP